MTYRINFPGTFPGQEIPDATPTTGGLMTAAQAQQLAALPASDGSFGASFQTVNLTPVNVLMLTNTVALGIIYGFNVEVTAASTGIVDLGFSELMFLAAVLPGSTTISSVSANLVGKIGSGGSLAWVINPVIVANQLFLQFIGAAGTTINWKVRGSIQLTPTPPAAP